jgi:hypothetical protein
MTNTDLILYSTEDGQAHFVLHEIGGQAWLTQLELADLYQTTKQNISLHVQNILSEGELSEEATVKENLTVQTEGSRQVSRKLAHYSLPMIIAVGYRVRSTRGSQFRQWATRTLSEYMLKGFVMDDARLKEPRWDYFDELLERIRDIRSSGSAFIRRSGICFPWQRTIEPMNRTPHGCSPKYRTSCFSQLPDTPLPS